MEFNMLLKYGIMTKKTVCSFWMFKIYHFYYRYAFYIKYSKNVK